jgi:hypothetical protein
MIDQIKAWWNKPWAKQRVMNAMSTLWRPGLDLWQEAGVSIGYFYVLMDRLEREGAVESKPDDQLDHTHLTARQGYGARLYRLKQQQERKT